MGLIDGANNMKLKVKILGMNAGDKPIAVLHEHDAEDLGVRSLGRILLKHGSKKAVVILNTTTKIVNRGEIGVFDEILEDMNRDTTAYLLPDLEYEDQEDILSQYFD